MILRVRGCILGLQMVQILQITLLMAVHLAHPADSQASPGLLESFMHLVMVDGTQNLRMEPKDTRIIQKEYDFIVVGAGSAGSIVANRLTEVADWKVLLIEAGQHENFLMDVPIMANFLQFTDANWNYRTQASNTSCLGMVKGQCHWPRGKVMGGSSVLNYMIYTRGNWRDYDNWERLGNTGWGWSNVLEYFKKLEDVQIPNPDMTYRSTGGYMTVSNPPYHTPIADAFLESARQSGHRIIDYNAATQTGFAYLQVSMRNGTRWSSSRAYLHPISTRQNLHVRKSSYVTKIVIDPATKTAVGVEFMRNNRRYAVRAKKEVIICAGAINSPQLLMLSGIGPRQHLKEKGIPVLQDLQVGANLQDHWAPGGLTYTIKYPYTLNTDRIASNLTNLVQYFSFHEGPMSVPGGCEAVGFIDLKNPKAKDGYADLELLMIAGGMNSEPTLMRNFNIEPKLYQEMYGPLGKRDTFMVFPMILRPKSVGKILLKNSSPFEKPLIYPNYYTDPEGNDIKVAIAGIRKMNALIKTPAFKAIGAKLYMRPLPPCRQHKFNTDAYWDCYARHLTYTIYHHVGTCKMGPDSDPTAVVDPRLRVRGIKNLRVIDASIMPVIPAAHTNVPTYMVAEKGADLIKEDHGNLIRR